MRMALSVVLGLLAVCSVGCSYVTKKLDAVSDDQLALYAHDAGYDLTGHAVALAQEKGSAKTVQTDGTVADQVLRNVVIPIFSKADVGSVAASSLDTAFAALKTKVTGSTLDQLYLVSKVALTMVTLPTNPADKINPRYHQALLSFFTGMAESLEKKLGLPGPAPAPAPTPPPSGTPPSPPK